MMPGTAFSMGLAIREGQGRVERGMPLPSVLFPSVTTGSTQTEMRSDKFLRMCHPRRYHFYQSPLEEAPRVPVWCPLVCFISKSRPLQEEWQLFDLRYENGLPTAYQEWPVPNVFGPAKMRRACSLMRPPGNVHCWRHANAGPPRPYEGRRQGLV